MTKSNEFSIDEITLPWPENIGCRAEETVSLGKIPKRLKNDDGRPV